MASYAVADPNTHQQVQQIKDLDWTFVTDINGLLSLIDKNPPMNEIDPLADKFSHDYEQSLPYITAQGGYIERDMISWCGQEQVCEDEVAVKEIVILLKQAINQYKKEILLLPSPENVKEVVNALKKDPKTEKVKLTEVKTAIENAKLKIEPAFLNMRKLCVELYESIYFHQ